MTTAPARTADPAVAARRQEAAAILRAVADLIEARPDLPEPTAKIHFFVSEYRCADVPAGLAAITTALPGPWQARISHTAGGADWLDLRAAAAGSSVTTGTTVEGSTPASEACAPSGTRTVTT